MDWVSMVEQLHPSMSPTTVEKSMPPLVSVAEETLSWVIHHASLSGNSIDASMEVVGTYMTALCLE